MPRTEDHTITPAELQRIMSGADGADFRIAGTSMRLVDVTPGSVAERLGGRNGDIVDSINGAPLSSVSKGYEAAYAAIKAKRIVLAGHRDGEPFVLKVTLSD